MMELAKVKNEKINSCSVGISKCNCFNTLSIEEKEYIDKNTVEISFNAGETICKQGTFATHIMFVSSGLLKVFMGEKNDQLILKIIPSENLAGLNSIYNGDNVFLYSISAYIPSKVKMIDINAFKKILKTNALFATEIISTLNSNVIQTYGRFFSLTKRQSYGRLADILLCLSDRIFRSKEFSLQLTRKEIAELCGMTTENVIRMLKKLKDEEVIKIEGKKFTIKNYSQLKKIRDLG